ncbi:MAG TPA: GGDEF domain-containing protein, partial [Bacillus sp. (in: firmicutes)]|nr:GGDEF domain-containing protein [Bacillus sp. (in: firmicutes)]
SVHFFKEFHDEEYRKWKMLAFTDELTGLLNWRKFKEQLKVEMKESDELQKPFGLFFIDIDNFKEINDQYGHIVGDRVLKQCAERLAGALGQKMYAFRKSGDEFLVLIKDIKQIEQTYQEIKKTFSRGFLIRQSIKQLTVSIGVSIYPECGHNEESIIHQANISMYREKIRRSK